MSTETLPVRILYKGASTVMWQSHGDRRAPGLLPYPRVVEQHLRARGHDVDTRVDAMSAQRVYDLMDRWERQATSEFPDVVVLHHGHMETVHAVIPRFIERHARANRERPGPVRQRYRRVLVRPLWKGLAVLQQRIDGAMPGPLARGLARRRARRTVAHLEQYLSCIDRLSSPLVVVMGLLPAGRVYADWFPGSVLRTEVIDRALRAMVARRDSPRLLYLDLWDEGAAWDARGEDPRPDGAHYTEAFHRRVGELLAARIEEWAATQPHLRG